MSQVHAYIKKQNTVYKTNQNQADDRNLAMKFSVVYIFALTLVFALAIGESGPGNPADSGDTYEQVKLTAPRQMYLQRLLQNSVDNFFFG